MVEPFLEPLYAFHKSILKRGVEGNGVGCLSSNYFREYNTTHYHESHCGSTRKRVCRSRHPQVRKSKKRITSQNVSKVFKIGEVELTPIEEQVLNKGLSFIPTPINRIRNISIEDFKRRIRLGLSSIGRLGTAAE